MNIPDLRLQYIIERIDKNGSVSVMDLANSLDVSEMTIRRDLSELEKIGLLRRVHGGAVSARGRSYEPPLTIRSNENRTVKQRLGKYAAGMVAEGDSISLDVGSTIHALAEHLKDTHNITVVTPSLSIASCFMERADVRLILPGGVVRPGETSMVGNLTHRNLQLLFVDRLFLGVGAIDSKAALTEYNMDDTLVKQIMIENAKEVVLVVDSTKFQKVAFAHVAPFKVIHHVITDEVPPKPLLEELKKNNLLIHVVDEDQTKVL